MQRSCRVVLGLALLSVLMMGQGCPLGITLPGTGNGNGNGDGNNDGATSELAVNAGADQTVNEGVTVTLTATVTGAADTPTYEWTQVSGPTATLTNGDKATATFTAPEVTTDQTCTFQVAVDDGTGAATDEVAITVKNVTGAVVAASSGWHLTAIAVGMDDLTGTVGDSIKAVLEDQLSGASALSAGGSVKNSVNMRAEASAAAQQLLETVLDAARGGDFANSFIQIDGDAPAIGTGVIYRQLDEDYNELAVGFPALMLTTESRLAEVLGVPIPIGIRADGPIIAVHKETIEQIAAVAEGAVESVVASAAGLGDGSALADCGIDEATMDGLVAQYQAAFEDLVGGFADFPVVPNGEGTAVFSKHFAYSLDIPVPKYTSIDTPPYSVCEATIHNFDLTLDVEFNMDLNTTLERWVGAASAFGQVSTADTVEDFESPQSLGLTVAAGIQKLSDETKVVFLEPADGTKVDAARLAGTWTAEFPASLITKEETTAKAFAKLVFDDAGNWTDVLLAVSEDGALPAADAFTSVTEELANLRTTLAEEGVTLPAEEYRTTIDAEGNVRLDFLIPELGTLLQEALAALNAPVSATQAGPTLPDIDLSGLPEMSLVSIVGKVSGNTLDANILFLVLYQPATFTK